MSIASARIALAVATAPLLIAAAGCSSTTPASNFVATADVTGAIGDTSATRPVRGADMSVALATMPEPLGSQLTMREKFYANGLRQDIVLAGDKTGFGENLLQVTVQMAPPSSGTHVPLNAPSERGIKQEILARYPKVDMQILTQPRRNAQGPFGLAIGRTAAGVRCIFAWQYIDDIRNPGSSSSTLGKLGSLGSSGQPASIRVQMCRKDATVDDLASAVEGLQLASPSLMERALDTGRFAAPVASTRGAGGAVASAGDGTLEGALGAMHPQRQTASAEPAPERRRVVARRAKKAVAEEQSEQQQSPVAPVASAAPVQAYTSGPRYMAPVAGAPAQSYAPATTAYNAPVYSTPSYTSSYATPSTKSLDPSLPAAAYRGPSGSR